MEVLYFILDINDTHHRITSVPIIHAYWVSVSDHVISCDQVLYY